MMFKRQEEVIPQSKKLVLHKEWKKDYNIVGNLPTIASADISCGLRMFRGIGYPIKGNLFRLTFFSKFPEIRGLPLEESCVYKTMTALGHSKCNYLDVDHGYVMSASVFTLEQVAKAIDELGLGITTMTKPLPNYNYSKRSIHGYELGKGGGSTIAVLVWYWSGTTCDPAKADVPAWYWDWKTGKLLDNVEVAH